jgi:hypothetical protein
MDFQATDACSNLGHTSVAHKTHRLSAVEKEEVIY